MQTSDASSNKQNSEQGSEEGSSGTDGTTGADGAKTGKKVREDAEKLPDGSNSDSRRDSENHGRENGEQGFDAG